MTKALSLFLTCFMAALCFAQQDKQFTNYMFDRISFNPATTGFKGYCGTFIYRNQWDRVQDAPNSTLVNFQGNIPSRNLGVGLSFTNDAIGFQRNNTLVLNGAYHLSLNAGTLSGGIGMGFINVGFSPDWVPPETFEDPLLPDPISGTGFDINAGLFWTGKTVPYYVGVSTTHLAPATLENINFQVARHYYVLAGYNFDIPAGRKIELKPNILIKADGATMVFDLNVNTNVWLNSYSYLWGGLSYRMQDAVAINVGWAFSPKQIASANMMKIGYSFDIMTNPLKTSFLLQKPRISKSCCWLFRWENAEVEYQFMRSFSVSF